MDETDRFADHGLGVGLSSAVDEELDEQDALLEIRRFGRYGLASNLFRPLEISIFDRERQRLAPEVAGELRRNGNAVDQVDRFAAPFVV